MTERVQAPALVHPDVFIVARLTAAAIDTALAVTRLLPLDRRPKRSRSHLSFEGNESHSSTGGIRSSSLTRS